MSKRIQLRRGTAAQNSAFTGAVAELSVDVDNGRLLLHDGSTAGGHPVGSSAGSGSPEGVVVARPGAMYLNTVDASLWAKRTGTSSTGWVQLVIPYTV